MIRESVKVVSALVLGCWLIGCGGGEPDEVAEPVLDTVDLPSGPTIDPDSDPRAPGDRVRLRGSLPAGFPDDLPLLLPARTAGSGTDDGWSWAAFDTPTAVESTLSQLGARVGAAGWDGEIKGRRITLRKGDRRAELDVEPTADGSRYRFRYR